MNGIYIWDITMTVRWTYHDKDEGEEEHYTVASPNSSEAINKAKKIALDKSRVFEEDIEGKTVKSLPVEVLDIVKLERGDWLDG